MNGFERQTSPQHQKLPSELIDVDLLTRLIAILSVVLVTLALLGQIELMMGIVIAVCVGIAWWGLRLNDLSTTRAERFTQLRQIVRLRNEDAPKPSPVVVFGIALGFAVFFCWNLSSSWRQYRASELPMVQGQITRHEAVDIDLGYQLEVDYDYQVAGKRYSGNRLRFVYRAFRVGTDDAKDLAATWRLGNQVSVFYNPNSPTMSVLDNTFCKGDELQVGLNASGLMLSVVAMIGAACVQLQTSDTEIVASRSKQAVAIPLSNAPLLGTFATLVAIGLLILTFVALMGGLISMGDAEIPWLVSTIEYLYAVTGAVFVIAATVYFGERVSFGLSGRELVIDNFRRTISWPSETLGETVSSDFANIGSVQVVSNREDWYRMARTFSVVASLTVAGGRCERKTIQRSYRRRDAVALATLVKSLIASKADPVRDFETQQVNQDGSRSLATPDSALIQI